MNSDDIPDDELLSKINEIEAPIVAEKDNASALLNSIVSQLEGIYWEKDTTGKIITNVEIANSLEEEIEELKKKNESDTELIQLGLAVNIIHHEFANSVKALRNSIRVLQGKAAIDKTLLATYNNLSTNFSHLDHYLSLLTPFSRRIRTEKEDIATNDIFLFMLDVFSGRLRRHNIECRRTGRFSQSKICSYRSVIYPAFANLVDNAIHWLKQSDNENKIIRLHIDSAGNMFVSNNGPCVPLQDQERIFDLGFTRKPNGRGMGLTISREVLKNAGYSLTTCGPIDEDMTVSFKISPISTGEQNA
ncbi:MAG: sensor histidine kinase [Ruminococcaceae bacterium]|nr:sensor histidine kinase [Oscillospiraceae bacterium]